MRCLRTRARRLVYSIASSAENLEAITAPRFPIQLAYPLLPLPRYREGNAPDPTVSTILARNRDAYGATLTPLATFSEQLARVSDTSDKASPQLAGFSRVKVLLALAHVSSDPSLADLTNSL
jgi:hypothetical protein